MRELLFMKSSLYLLGLRATAGFKSFKNWRSPDDAPCVALMKEAGAIIIATTNVPELAMNVETFNKLHGVTRNPYDINRTCGGTSGGEVALIASGGSILGLGNDILGSLRLPAHFAGVFTHMPTRGLVSNNGSFPPGKISCPAELDGCEKMPFLTVGPISRYAEDLIISMRILSSQNEVWKTFGQQVDFKKLKIRYLTEIETYVTKPVDKEITDSLKDAVSYFEKRYGIKGEEIKMPSLYHSVKSTVRCGTGKAAFNITKNWSKEEFDSLLDEDTILLLPTSPFTAPYHYEMVFLFPNACYTSVLNLVGLPATHCPMGLSKQGMPYGIQIVGRKNNDNLTIACAIELEKAFGGWKSPGKT
ncbi:fatty-acid amide hydrolase 2-B [Nephila pilipes]|uniref:Fatty-acid amide hydrolase 2-B n=1 Tax=Nephila pilipes TaxID=299642 RepID=A0A8X6UCN5_NEPPI|nr:fatty-acid amide hydrolase 2-B [Nephila pilipes]